MQAGNTVTSNIFTGKRYPLYATYEVGVDEKGVIQNMTAELYSDYGIGMGNENVNPWVMDCFENGYNIDKWTYDTFVARTDTPPNTYARAPGRRVSLLPT